MAKGTSLEERLEYAENHLDEILDSAEKPFRGKCWWMNSPNPRQTLAACMEVKAALDSGNPEEFVSHLPVHQVSY